MNKKPKNIIRRELFWAVKLNVVSLFLEKKTVKIRSAQCLKCNELWIKMSEFEQMSQTSLYKEYFVFILSLVHALVHEQPCVPGEVLTSLWQITAGKLG